MSDKVTVNFWQKGSGMNKLFSKIRYRLSYYPEIVAIISFVLFFIFFAYRADNFLSLLSLTNIISLASIKGVMVIGVAILMISGEFDLSVGSILGVASYVFALTLLAGVPAFLSFLIALAVSALLGVINGLIVVKTRIPSFIATLGTMLAYRGVARALGRGDYARYVAEGRLFLFDLFNGDMSVINNLSEETGNLRSGVFWFIGFVIIASIIMNRTRFGNWVYATGGNRAAALAQGVKTNAIIIWNFVLTGLLAGFAGVMGFAWRMVVDPRRGQGFELITVAACVIGGIWMKGGYGKILGAAMGILLLSMVEQGLVLMGVSVELFQAAVGLILIVAVVVSTYISKN
jgi:simple sugar transport system permease protein